MACIKFDGETDMVNLVDRIITEHVGGANIFVITDRSDDEIRKILRDSISTGYQTSYVCVTQDQEDRIERSDELEGIRRDGVKVASVTSTGMEPISF